MHATLIGTGRNYEAKVDRGVQSLRIYNYYKQRGYKTTVVDASFRNVRSSPAYHSYRPLTRDQGNPTPAGAGVLTPDPQARSHWQ